MGLDELHLRVLATSSEDMKEKANAQKGKRRCSIVTLSGIRVQCSSFSVETLGQGSPLGFGCESKTVFIFMSQQLFFKVLLLGNVVRLSQPREYYNV